MASGLAQQRRSRKPHHDLPPGLAERIRPGGMRSLSPPRRLPAVLCQAVHTQIGQCSGVGGGAGLLLSAGVGFCRCLKCGAEIC